MRYLFGEWHKADAPLTAEEVADICRKAEVARQTLRDYPDDKVLRLLDRVRAKWADPLYPRLATLRAKLPLETGFTLPMIELGIQELVWVLDSKLLRRKRDVEMHGIPSDPDMTYESDTQTILRREPLGIVLHVLAGNVFLVGAGSLVEGLLTGNVTILKQSSNERVFLPELIESIRECDEDGVVSASIAVIDYSSSQKDVIAELKKRVDGIVVWGGEEAVKAYRNDCPARVRIIVFGPKLSLAVVTKSGIERYGIETIADKLAWEMTIWDQNACTAPQVCYVDGETEAKLLAESTALALEAWQRKIPVGNVDPNAAVEIQKLRGVAVISEARGQGLVRASQGNVNWTVIVSQDATLEPSPLHRTLKIVPIDSIATVIQEAEKLRGYVQTIGLAVGTQEAPSLWSALARHGALRIFELGVMSGGEIADPHDGAYDLPQLVNFVVTRLPQMNALLDPRDCLIHSERKALLDARLRRLIDRARQSAFYGERFKGVVIDGVDDLRKVPILTREEMDANMPPKGTGLQTGEYWGGYVSRSGGSTGEPKFSIYDANDWEHMIAEAVRVLKGAGVEKGDRVANCMLAGDLYGSFVSFDHINWRIGATTFAFAGQADPEAFLDTWRKFKINMVQGMPTKLGPLLRAVKKLEPDFKMPKVLYAGMPLSPSDQQWMKDALGTTRIASVIGANDGGQLGYQCEHLTGGRHHLIDDFNYVEIVDNEGHPVAEGMPGRIVITSLLKYAFPLIRYELGDAGRIVGATCPCGRTSRIMEHLGRSDDTVCVGNMNLRYRDLLDAMAGLEFSALQVAARNDADGEYLVLRIESDSRPDGIETRVKEIMLRKVAKLEERLADRSLTRFEVQWVEQGKLPRNPRSGKVKQLCDERT